ncbi:MAG: SDR family NAD(P)-dependent oxidoreductase [Halobacteriota archaeon]|uniref:SDR family NAD(P)-dependent oxidoreductase n=1 Tax=Natronomonas sp. TaxID=2184060 RepID=UPI003974C023
MTIADLGITADLNGQVAAVVGGTTGIGRAISEALSEAGADVVPTSRTESSVREAAEAVDCDVVCPTDVTDRESVEEFFERVEGEVGPINILINSAGVIQEAQPVSALTDEEWELILDTNLYGVFVGSQLIPEYMPDEGNRAILNISSMNGDQAVKGLTAYVASKFGVKGLTQNFALEYAGDDIRVNAIGPGYVETRQNEEALNDPDTKAAIHGRTPLSRYANLDEVAVSALYLVSPAASFITGETLLIDGGFSLK